MSAVSRRRLKTLAVLGVVVAIALSVRAAAFTASGSAPGFSPTGWMAVAREDATGTLLADGRVLIAGGYHIANGDMAELVSAELYNPATGTFGATGSMTTARWGGTATLLRDGRVLMAGGEPTDARKSAETYDPKTGKFTSAGSMLAGRWGATATLLRDGRVLLVGGDDQDTAELYDPVTGRFGQTGPIVTYRDPFGALLHRTATLLSDGRVLIAGASEPSAQLYDPATGEFTETGSMVTTRQEHVATLLADGSVLITGGFTWATNGSESLSSAEVYDPASGTFHETGQMASGREWQSATLLFDGRVLIAGGQRNLADPEPPFLALNSAELYDPGTGKFSSAGSMTTARAGQTATRLVDGRVLLTGGYHDVYTDLASAELYQPPAPNPISSPTRRATSTPRPSPCLSPNPCPSPTPSPTRRPRWTPPPAPTARIPSPWFIPAGPMSTAGAGHTATLLRDGRVLIAGGAYGSAQEPDIFWSTSVASAELFDPATGAFAATGWMTTARAGSSATLLRDGRVLIAGGVGIDPQDKFHGPILSSAELYDPATGAFTATGSMTIARAYQTATLMSDGRVLIIGGTGDASAEVYDPATGKFNPTGSLTIPRNGASATLLADGRILVAGGDTPGSTTGTAVLASADLYDPKTGTFSRTGSMTIARLGHTATRLPDGRVLIAGGATNGIGSTFTDSAEIYNPATGRFNSTGSMATERVGQTSTLLTDGRVLIAGGDEGPVVRLLGTAEIYNPASGAFIPAGVMYEERADTATLLRDGRVLLVGGNAELYNPAIGP